IPFHAAEFNRIGLAAVNQCYKLLKMVLNTDFWESSAALIGGLLVVGQMYRVEKRPRGNLSPRLFPTTLVLLLGLLVALGAGAHLLSLTGIHPPPSQP
ncbi:MAG: hypothetical protein ABJA10_05605, partial [Aestuariivirga sp.]